MTSPREPQERPGSRLHFDLGRWTLVGEEEIEDLAARPEYIVLGPEVDAKAVDDPIVDAADGPAEGQSR